MSPSNGAISPGNSIGTLNITGNYTQNPGSTYQVEVGSQSDLINITGNATINGGTVAVQGVAGAAPKTYTIVTATGGVAGTYSGLTQQLRLRDTVSLLRPEQRLPDAADVLCRRRRRRRRDRQRDRGRRCAGQDQDAAKGDLDTVVTVLANLDKLRGLPALDAISGQPWADFGTMNINNGVMFMNAFGQQMANARGAASAGQRQALAQACEIAACDGTGPLSAWASALGGLGSVLGDGNAATLTYNFAGAAAGLDYRFDPRFLVGIGVGYTHGWEWVNAFPGQGLYRLGQRRGLRLVHAIRLLCRCAGGLRLLQQPAAAPDHDPRPGPAHRHRQHRRQPVPRPDRGRLQGSTSMHPPPRPSRRSAASRCERDAEWVHRESGAQSLDLNVFQQTTNSQRTTIGADLAGAIGIGDEQEARSGISAGLDARVCRYRPADHGGFCRRTGERLHRVRRPAGSATAAVLGLSAMANIAAATQLYLRYDGEVATGTDNHAINLGVRFSW